MGSRLIDYIKQLSLHEEVIIFSSGGLYGISFADCQRAVYRGEVQDIPLKILNSTQVSKEYYNEAFNCKVLRIEAYEESSDWSLTEILFYERQYKI